MSKNIKSIALLFVLGIVIFSTVLSSCKKDEEKVCYSCTLPNKAQTLPSSVYFCDVESVANDKKAEYITQGYTCEKD